MRPGKHPEENFRRGGDRGIHDREQSTCQPAGIQPFHLSQLLIQPWAEKI
jgi:hypothetical protein